MTTPITFMVNVTTMFAVVMLVLSVHVTLVLTTSRKFNPFELAGIILTDRFLTK